ncbi:MAG: Uma2 family endonuclease [Anaerolineae bacterium]|nr:Uma2 family endonuclease [Anaerolineae bacterium]
MITLPIQITETTQAVRGKRQGDWTAADWERLPDDGNRYEIIEGVLYVSTAPSYFHQWIVLALYEQFGIPARNAGLGYSMVAPIGVFMEGAAPVQPDFLLIRAENAHIIRDRRIYGVPDLIIEVMSPGSAAYDEGVKLEAYAAAGVPEYAVVNPAERSVTVYQLQGAGQFTEGHTLREQENLAFAALPGLSTPVESLYAGAPDTTL